MRERARRGSWVVEVEPEAGYAHFRQVGFAWYGVRGLKLRQAGISAWSLRNVVHGPPRWLRFLVLVPSSSCNSMKSQNIPLSNAFIGAEMKRQKEARSERICSIKRSFSGCLILVCYKNQPWRCYSLN